MAKAAKKAEPKVQPKRVRKKVVLDEHEAAIGAEPLRPVVEPVAPTVIVQQPSSKGPLIMVGIAAVVLILLIRGGCHSGAPGFAVNGDTTAAMVRMQKAMDSMHALLSQRDSATVEAIEYADKAHAETENAMAKLSRMHAESENYLSNRKKQSDEIKNDIQSAATIRQLDSLKDRILLTRRLKNADH